MDSSRRETTTSGQEQTTHSRRTLSHMLNYILKSRNVIGPLFFYYFLIPWNESWSFGGIDFWHVHLSQRLRRVMWMMGRPNKRLSDRGRERGVLGWPANRNGSLGSSRLTMKICPNLDSCNAYEARSVLVDLFCE